MLCGGGHDSEGCSRLGLSLGLRRRGCKALLSLLSAIVMQESLLEMCIPKKSILGVFQNCSIMFLFN